MTTKIQGETVSFRKRDFEVSLGLVNTSDELCQEFAKAVCRARPSRLDNVLEIEVAHKADSHVHQTLQLVCDKGARWLTLKTVYPIPSPIADDPRSYMTFEYKDGRVQTQWMEMSRCAEDGDELMVDVMKIAFLKKIVTNCVWNDDDTSQRPKLIAGKDYDSLS